MAEITKAELQVQLTDMTKRATDAEATATSLTAQLETATAAATEAGNTIAAQAVELDRVHGELRAANASLKAYKGSATKARTEATVLRKQLSPEPRNIGAMKPPRDAMQETVRRQDLEAAFVADTSELVFSDGRREIRELAPLTITADAWRVTVNGARTLNHEPLLEPGDCQRQQMELRGFGLVNEAGDQVGYCPLPDAILIGRNQRFQLPLNTIRF